MFVTEIENWVSVARAPNEVFADIRPAATLMEEVARLIDPETLVEI